MKTEQNPSPTLTATARLWILTSFFILIVSLLGGFSVYSEHTLSKDLETLAEVQLPAVRLMTLTDMMHDGIRANVYRTLIALEAQSADLTDSIQESKEFSTHIKDYTAQLLALRLDNETKDAVQSALPSVDAYVKAAEQLIAYAKQNQIHDFTKNLPPFLEQFDKLEKDLGKLGDLIEQRSRESRVQSFQRAQTLKNIMLVVLAAAIILALFFATITIRGLKQSLINLVSNLGHEATTLERTAMALSSSARNLQSRVQQQATSLEQTASSLSEITATSKKTDESTQSLSRYSEQSVQSARQGQGLMDSLVNRVSVIKETNHKILSQMNESNSKFSNIVNMISEIDKKTQVIHDIVLQTKLLSFNASVEAARAGEHGKGFAVVADEVGKLAEMSGTAAHEITTMVSTSVQGAQDLFSANASLIGKLVSEGTQNVESGHQIAAQCQRALEDILNSANEVETMVSQISTAIKEQSLGVQEIGGAVGIIEETNQGNSQTASDTTNHASAILNQVTSLNSMVQKLKQQVG